MLYFNPSGRYVTQLVGAIDRIGATRHAGVIGDVHAMFPGSAPATDDEKRWRQLEQLPAEAASKAAALDHMMDDLIPYLHGYYYA